MGKSGKTGAALLRILIWPIAILPLSWSRKLGKFAGWLLGSVFHYRNYVVYSNIARSFPDMTYDQVRQAGKKSYEHLATLFCEAIWMGGHSLKDIKESHIAEVTNPELLNSLHAHGKPLYVMLSHMGNWEILGGTCKFSYKEPLLWEEDNLVVVYLKLHNAAWDEFMKVNRKRPLDHADVHQGLVETFDVMRYAIRNRDVMKVYHFIMDQYPYSDSSKVPVKFMGRDTVSMNGAPLLAHKFGSPVVYLSMKVAEDGNYRLTYKLLAEDASQCSTDYLLERYYELLEEDLKDQPWNYLWTHKRWK